MSDSLTNETNRCGLKLGLTRLKLRAMEAHSSKDVATVNHCCAILFEQLVHSRQANAEYKPTLMECRWAFSLSLYWLTDTYMIYSAEVAHRAAADNTSDKGIFDFIAIVISLIKRPLLSSQEISNRISEVKWDWAKDSSDEEDGILLQLGSELCFTRDPWDCGWESLIDIGMSILSEPCKSALERTKRRLQVQREMFYPRNIRPVNISIDSSADENTRYFVGLVSSFLNFDWSQLKSLIEQVVPKLDFASADALPLTNLICELNHFQVLHWKADDQYVRLTRMRLFEYAASSKSPGWTGDIRSLSFYKSLLTFKEGTLSDDRKADSFRLSSLNEVWALRNWSIGHWVEAIKQKALAFDHLHRHGGQDDVSAILALKHYVYATTFKSDLPGSGELIAAFERIDKDLKIQFVRQMMCVREYASRSVLELFTLLSDAIPYECLGELLEWCLRFIDRSAGDSLLKPRPYKAIGIWKDILGTTANSEDLCRSLRPLYLETVRDSQLLLDDCIHSVYRYMLNAGSPELLAIFQLLIDEDSSIAPHLTHRKWTLFFTVLESRHERFPEIETWLRNNATGDTERRALELLVSYPSEDIQDLVASAKPWAIEQINNYLAVITDEGRTGFGGNAGVSASMVEKIQWTVDDRHIFERLFAAIVAPRVTVIDIRYCLDIARAMLRSNPADFGSVGLEHILRLLQTPPTARDFLLRSENESQEYGVLWEDMHETIAVLVDVYPSRSIPALKLWLIDNYLRAPVSASGSILRTAIIIGCGAAKGDVSAADCFPLHEELAIASVLLERCIVASRGEHAESHCLVGYLVQLKLIYSKPALEVEAPPVEYVTIGAAIRKMVENRIEELVRHPIVDVRVATAYLLMEWARDAEFERCSVLGGSLKALGDDPRARVRVVVGGCSNSWPAQKQ
ncbi:MAG: hypothetical protein KF886_15410 [Candidatus Hydrogenedentes bacterium]|nr:hypothetical protein [Candidatus Hydrogenedentota bacterium]